MKKLFFSGAIALALLFTGCNKSEISAVDNVKKDVVSKVLSVSLSTSDNSQDAPQLVKQLMQRVKSISSSDSIEFPFDMTVSDSIGKGKVHFKGSMVMYISDNLSSSTTKFNMDETFTNYTVVSDKKNYACSGTIKCAYNMSATQSSATFTCTLKGTLAIKGTDYNQNAVINIKGAGSINASGASTYTITGTIDGEPVNYAFK